VRNLERLIGAVCRHVAMRVAEGGVERMRID
jgi:ATP-dependent Lon protease